MSYSFVVGVNCITIILDGQSYMVERSSSTGDRVVDLLRNKASEEELLSAVHVAQADDVLAAKGGLDAFLRSRSG